MDKHVPSAGYLLYIGGCAKSKGRGMGSISTHFMHLFELTRRHGNPLQPDTTVGDTTSSTPPSERSEKHHIEVRACTVALCIVTKTGMCSSSLGQTEISPVATLLLISTTASQGNYTMVGLFICLSVFCTNLQQTIKCK